MPAPVVIRPALSSDANFILDSMRRTLLRQSAYAAGLEPDVINQLVWPVIATYDTLVATPPDDDDEILGYIIHDGPGAVGFIYVKEAVRGRGLANALLDAAQIAQGEIICPLLVTKLSGVGNFAKFCETKGYTVRFRPWLPLSINAQLMNPKPVKSVGASNGSTDTTSKGASGAGAQDTSRPDLDETLYKYRN